MAYKGGAGKERKVVKREEFKMSFLRVFLLGVGTIQIEGNIAKGIWIFCSEV